MDATFHGYVMASCGVAISEAGMAMTEAVIYYRIMQVSVRALHPRSDSLVAFLSAHSDEQGNAVNRDWLAGGFTSGALASALSSSSLLMSS